MNDIQKADPNDIFVDADGKLWRVEWTCSSPTVGMVEIEPINPDNPQEIEGGIGGQMWEGFKLIHKHEHKKIDDNSLSVKTKEGV